MAFCSKSFNEGAVLIMNWVNDLKNSLYANHLSVDFGMSFEQIITLNEKENSVNILNVKDGHTYILALKQDCNGGRCVNWGNRFKWPNGEEPVLSTKSNYIDVVSFTLCNNQLLGTFQGSFKG